MRTDSRKRGGSIRLFRSHIFGSVREFHDIFEDESQHFGNFGDSMNWSLASACKIPDDATSSMRWFVVHDCEEGHEWEKVSGPFDTCAQAESAAAELNRALEEAALARAPMLHIPEGWAVHWYETGCQCWDAPEMVRVGFISDDGEQLSIDYGYDPEDFRAHGVKRHITEYALEMVIRRDVAVVESRRLAKENCAMLNSAGT